jgi:hypothetical protein
MLSGKRRSEDSVGGPMAAILRDEPLPLPSGVPEPLDRVIRRCLEKDRDNRFQSARDIVFALGEASSGTTSLPPSPAPQPAQRPRIVPAAVAVVLLALATAALFCSVLNAAGSGSLASAAKSRSHRGPAVRVGPS